jgi:hypothetical protein
MGMTITKQTVANQIAAYLHNEITLAQLVDWAENSLLDGAFAPRDAKVLSAVIARLGVADVRAFGLTWEDCEHFLAKLGYTAQVEVIAAGSEAWAVREKPAQKYGK